LNSDLLHFNLIDFHYDPVIRWYLMWCFIQKVLYWKT